METSVVDVEGGLGEQREALVLGGQMLLVFLGGSV